MSYPKIKISAFIQRMFYFITGTRENFIIDFAETDRSGPLGRFDFDTVNTD